jgi:hypothetical protein
MRRTAPDERPICFQNGSSCWVRCVGNPPYSGHSANKSQFFEGISPDVWEFLIGGYQVLDKWLKDRQGWQLSHDDLTHYQQVVVAVCKTIELMEKIDNTVPGWPVGQHLCNNE